MLLSGVVDFCVLFVGYIDLDKVVKHTHKLPHESKYINNIISIEFQKRDILK